MGRSAQLSLPYVNEFQDRHGRVRRYFRRPGYPRSALPGEPGSPEFMAAYSAALASQPLPERVVIAEAPGTMGGLIAAYYRSPAFRTLKASTQATYRGILERLRAEHGTKSVSKLQRRNVQALIDRKAETPAAANNLLKLLRLLMHQAIKLDWRYDDPTEHVEPIRHRSKGFHTWAEDEIEQFERRWPIGSKPRLAMALMLFTGAARADVVGLGPQMIRAGRIRYARRKSGVAVDVPVHVELARVIAAAPVEQLVFLTTSFGQPFTEAGFGNWFREACNAAGLSHCSAHGLRKAASRRLAEAGATTREAMAVLGHLTLKEAERYSAEASRAHLATAAIAKLGDRKVNDTDKPLERGTDKPKPER